MKENGLTYSGEQMTIAEKALSIFKHIQEICNGGKKVSFERDFGDNTLTVLIGDFHSHIGYPTCNFPQMIDNLYNLLDGGQGLSWMKDEQIRKTKD